MEPQYVAKINNIHDVKSRIIYDWISAKQEERKHRKEKFLYRDKGYSFYKQDTTKNHYKHLEEIASDAFIHSSIASVKMWMSIGRQLNARSLWDSIVRSEKIWPKEPQSKEDFDFSAIQEEDIPFNNEGE